MNDYPSILLFIMSAELALGLGSAAAGVMNSLLGTAANANLNSRNRHWQEKMSQLAYDRQKELTMLSPVLQKQGLLNAGISPAAMNGYSGGTASVSSGAPAPSSVAPYVPFDVSSLFQGLMAASQMDNVKANTRKTNADADAQELANNKERNLQSEWMSHTTKNFVIDDKGNKLFNDDPRFADYINDYYNTHGELPEMQSQAGVLSEDAARVQASLSKFSSDLHTNEMYSVQSDLAKKVAQMKLADTDVMHAIYKLDKAQYDLLIKQIQKVGSDIDVNKTLQQLNNAQTKKAKQDVLESIARSSLMGTQEKQIKNSSVNNLIDQLNSSKSFSENMVTLGKIILSLIGGFSGAKF